MEKVKIKRVKRNKKEITTAEKVMAGIGVGSTLLGGGLGGGTKPQAQNPIVASQGAKTSGVQKAEKAIKDFFTIPTAKADDFGGATAFGPNSEGNDDPEDSVPLVEAAENSGIADAMLSAGASGAEVTLVEDNLDNPGSAQTAAAQQAYAASVTPPAVTDPTTQTTSTDPNTTAPANPTFTASPAPAVQTPLPTQTPTQTTSTPPPSSLNYVPPVSSASSVNSNVVINNPFATQLGDLNANTPGGSGLDQALTDSPPSASTTSTPLPSTNSTPAATITATPPTDTTENTEQTPDQSGETDNTQASGSGLTQTSNPNPTPGTSPLSLNQYLVTPDPVGAALTLGYSPTPVVQTFSNAVTAPLTPQEVIDQTNVDATLDEENYGPGAGNYIAPTTQSPVTGRLIDLNSLPNVADITDPSKGQMAILSGAPNGGQVVFNGTSWEPVDNTVNETPDFTANVEVYATPPPGVPTSATITTNGWAFTDPSSGQTTTYSLAGNITSIKNSAGNYIMGGPGTTSPSIQSPSLIASKTPTPVPGAVGIFQLGGRTGTLQNGNFVPFFTVPTAGIQSPVTNSQSASNFATGAIPAAPGFSVQTDGVIVADSGNSLPVSTQANTSTAGPNNVNSNAALSAKINNPTAGQTVRNPNTQDIYSEQYNLGSAAATGGSSVGQVSATVQNVLDTNANLAKLQATAQADQSQASQNVNYNTGESKTSTTLNMAVDLGNGKTITTTDGTNYTDSTGNQYRYLNSSTGLQILTPDGWNIYQAPLPSPGTVSQAKGVLNTATTAGSKAVAKGSAAVAGTENAVLNLVHLGTNDPNTQTGTADINTGNVTLKDGTVLSPVASDVSTVLQDGSGNLYTQSGKNSYTLSGTSISDINGAQTPSSPDTIAGPGGRQLQQIGNSTYKDPVTGNVYNLANDDSIEPTGLKIAPDGSIQATNILSTDDTTIVKSVAGVATSAGKGAGVGLLGGVFGAAVGGAIGAGKALIQNSSSTIISWSTNAANYNTPGQVTIGTDSSGNSITLDKFDVQAALTAAGTNKNSQKAAVNNLINIAIGQP